MTEDYEMALSVYHEKDGWSYYDWLGKPCGPYVSLFKAWDALEDYLFDDYEKYEIDSTNYRRK